MSLCPTKDIHSVYLDNELPLSYVKDYEAHVQSCPECSAELEKLKKMRGMLQLGGKPEMSKFEMEAGFQRLQIRMNYSKNTKHLEKKPVVQNVFKYAVPAMAAAAVFAFVLPVGIRHSENAVADISAIASLSPNTVSFERKSAAVLSGNLPNTMVSPVSGNTVSLERKNAAVLSGNLPNTAVVSRKPVTTPKTKSRIGIQDVDVFGTNFDNGNTISIKITVPGINAVPYTTEIDLPVDLYKGYVE